MDECGSQKMLSSWTTNAGCTLKEQTAGIKDTHSHRGRRDKRCLVRKGSGKGLRRARTILTAPEKASIKPCCSGQVIEEDSDKRTTLLRSQASVITFLLIK